MGQGCSSACGHLEPNNIELSRTDSPDPVMYDLMRKSIQATTPSAVDGNHSPHGYRVGKRKPPGQNHLMYRNSKIETMPVSVPVAVENTTSNAAEAMETKCYAPASVAVDSGLWLPRDTPVACPTRLLIRRRSLRVVEEGGGTHIYAIRYPEDTPDRIISEQATPRLESARQEQCPPKKASAYSATTGGKSVAQTVAAPVAINTSGTPKPKVVVKHSLMEGTDIFSTAAMASRPRQEVMDWVTVSEDHNIYIADVGLTAMQCDHIVNTTEQVCRGQYAAYTYAKQTLGCREFPILAQTSFSPVHTVTSDIIRRLADGKRQYLHLDDREPHIVKYDVTKKERQKLDMHTDKSEWTFLIALSNGCGVDYEGGGTYFECLDATVHIQRGHALIFPGKLRHCGQKITSGLRFLLVGFLVDKTSNNKNTNDSSTAPSTNAVTATTAAAAVAAPTTVPVKA